MRTKPITHCLFFAQLCLILMLPGCAQESPPAPTPPPIPQSQWISEFIQQEDQGYGYSMLRPGSWRSADDAQARVYYPDPQDNQLRLTLSAVNLKVYASNMKAGSTDVRWSLFTQSPELESWTDALVRTIYQRDVIQLEQSLDNAQVYSVRSLQFGNHIQLVAFIVDQSTPLEITLNVGGQQENLLAEIRQSGLMDDFITMVESVHAFP